MERKLFIMSETSDESFMFNRLEDLIELISEIYKLEALRLG